MQHNERLLEGKNAVITGTGRGIGKAAVKVFAQCGANVWACARKRDHQWEEELSGYFENGSWIKFLYFDMRDEEGMKDAVKSIHKDRETVDILVNNAGMSYDALLPMVSMDKARELFEVNFFCHVCFTQLIGRIMMKQKRGTIINVSSYLAEDGNRGQSLYSASKAAVNAFTRSIANELSAYNIRVNAVAPGLVDTDMTAAMSAEERGNVMEKCWSRRSASPEEIGNAIAVIASDMGAYINGQIVRIDGGMG